MYLLEQKSVVEVPVEMIIEKLDKESEVYKPMVSKIELVKYDDNMADYSHLESKFYYDQYDDILTIVDSCQYSDADIEEYGQDKVLEWLMQDKIKLEELGYTWSYCGIGAKVTVKIPHKTVEGSIHFFEQKLESKILWNIEDNYDSASDIYFEEVFNEQLFQFQADLRKMNIDVTLIENYFNDENGIA